MLKDFYKGFDDKRLNLECNSTFGKEEKNIGEWITHLKTPHNVSEKI